jgi:hypothetical protein
MYKVETKNGAILESPSIRDIMDELASSEYEYDEAVKFYYTDNEDTVFSYRDAVQLITEKGRK